MPKKGESPSSNREAVILRGATENTNEGFVTIDEHHQVIIFNKAAEKIFGYSREEVIGKDLGLILSPGCEQGHKQAVSRFLETREIQTHRPSNRISIDDERMERSSLSPFLFRFRK